MPLSTSLSNLVVSDVAQLRRRHSAHGMQKIIHEYRFSSSVDLIRDQLNDEVVLIWDLMYL